MTDERAHCFIICFACSTLTHTKPTSVSYITLVRSLQCLSVKTAIGKKFLLIRQDFPVTNWHQEQTGTMPSKSQRIWKTAVLIMVMVVLFIGSSQKSLSSISLSMEYGKETFREVVVNDSNSTSTLPAEKRRFRMLIGIFTMDSSKEFAQRKFLRNTYLSLPKFFEKHNVSTVSQRESRICSLQDFWHGNLTHREDCQLLYTFVVGAADASIDSRATTEYVRLDEGRPIALESGSKKRDLEEPNDITYLNIVENMNDGKTPTWFKYASSQLPSDMDIDLIAKADTDCLVYPRQLICAIDSIGGTMGLSPPYKRLYGGSRQRGNDTSYMQGGFYFMSPDVAAYITSDDCDREKIIREYKPEYGNERAEDVETSRFVLSYPKGPVHELVIPRGRAYLHNTRMKGKTKFRDEWKWYVATEVAEDRILKVQRAYNSSCPPREALDKVRESIDPELVRIVSRFDLLTKQLRGRCEKEEGAQM